MNDLGAILKGFMAMALFKIKPQDLPTSKPLLNLALCLYGCVSLLHTATYTGFGSAIQVTLLDLALLLGLMYFWLWLFRFKNRWQQTVTALAGGGSVIGLFAIPTSLAIAQVEQYPLLAAIAGYIMFFILVWTIGFFAHVFRHAFSTLFVVGVFMAIVYNVLIITLISTLVPEITTT